MKGESKAKGLVCGEGRAVGYVVEAVLCELVDIGEQDLREVMNDEGIIELAADIAKRGLLQPIGVRRLPTERFQLLWGKRRLTAHRRLGARLIEARVVEGSGEAVKAVALVENLHRRAMTLSEECKAVAYLVEEDKLSADQICTVLSKSRAWVNRRLAIPGMPLEVRDALLDDGISLGVAEELCKLSEYGQRAYLLQHAVVGKLGLTQVRALVEGALAVPSVEGAVQAGVDEAVAAAQPSRLQVQCAACGEMQDSARMVVVRVCAVHTTAGYEDGKANGGIAAQHPGGGVQPGPVGTVG